MSGTRSEDCRRTSWIAAAVAGALVALVFLFGAGYSFLASLVIGLVVCAVLGFVLGAVFCGQAVDTAPVQAAPLAGPASAPVVTPEPAPLAADPTPPVEEPVARDAAPGLAAGLDAALAKSKDEPIAAPELLSAPREGRADDLKLIKGVGPKLEALLNEVGVWHFDQIAAWKAKDIAFVDEKMVGFHGRITRDEWVKQAKLLAKGGSTEFSKRARKAGAK